jgi:polysaccharide biosynthesis/export protein
MKNIYTKSIVKLLLWCFVLTVGSQLSAQQQKVENLSDEQIRQFFDKAKASGMTENQIEAAALQQGYSASDIAKMRERISKLSATSSATNTTNSPQTQAAKVQVAEPAQRATPVSEEPVSKKSNIFGSSLFNNASLTFEPNLRIATPKNYILGPDDELVIDIVGFAQITYKSKVSPEGTIRIENIQPIYVNGLTIEQASERIIGRLRQRYEGLNAGGGVYAQVSLGAVKSIKVTITGEAVRPGTYTISSLATVFNALYQAGGPSSNGSYRSIKVMRNNQIVRTIDLYDFLLRSDQRDNIALRDQDVIRIDYYGKRVEVDGQVKNPAIYEVMATETLQNVLEFAGGFTDQAYRNNLTVRRNTLKELKMLSVQPKEISSFVVESGDKVTVGTILNRYENRVVIEGAIFRPGEYALSADISSIKTLISKAEGLREDAFLTRASIIREKDNLDVENISFDLGKLMKGEIADIPLKRQDRVVIKGISELREKRTVVVTGAINGGGKFDYVENMSVTDLILQAGGFTEAAIPNRIEVSRRVKGGDTTNVPTNQNVIIYQFDIDSHFRMNTDDAKFKLQPFDIVYVRSSPRYEVQPNVYITGEVNFNGLYPIKVREERITDLIAKAGGLRKSAYLKGAKFYRNHALVAIDLQEVMRKPSLSANLLLESGDSLAIPRISELVNIQGSVLNANIVNYDPRFTFNDYMQQAGGFNENAWKRKIYVTYSNGRVARTKKFLFLTSHPTIEPGAVIQVPSKPEKSKKETSVAEKVAVASAVSSLTFVVITIINKIWP